MPWRSEDEISDFEIDRRDLADPRAPGALLDAVVATHGAIDIVVAVHARSSSQSLATMTADDFQNWVETVQHFGKWFHRAAGRPESLALEAQRRQRHWLSGISHSREAFG